MNSIDNYKLFIKNLQEKNKKCAKPHFFKQFYAYGKYISNADGGS